MICVLCADPAEPGRQLCARCDKALRRDAPREQTKPDRPEEPRLALVAHLRDQIKAGTYVTKGKLRAVAGKLIEEEGL